jgi:uncharacterized protein
MELMVIRFRLRRLLTVLLVAGFSLAGVASSAAFTVTPTKTLKELSDTSDPYEANDIVTGFGVEARQAGFAHCLREVLVRLSGEPRLERDQRVMALAAHADSMVASFDYADVLLGLGFPVHDDQGTGDRPDYLVVRFDHAKIDKALSDLGERPWRAPHPQVVPVLAMRGPSVTYLLSAEAKRGADQRGSLAAAALQYGLALRIPTEGELAAWAVGLEGFPNPRAEPKGEEALVAGTLEFDEAKLGWVGAWRMRWRGVDYARGIGGVNFDEAFRALMRGVARVASGHGAPD